MATFSVRIYNYLSPLPAPYELAEFSEGLCKHLKLSYIKDNYEILIDEAKKTNQSHEEFLHLLLENENSQRLDNSIKRRIREAKFPQNVHMSDFDKTVYDSCYLEKFKEFETLNFINEKRNLILRGASGAGKTYYASALGMLACMQGMSVLFITLADLIIKLKENMSLNQISTLKRKFQNYDLIILDELGYYSFDTAVAELFFNLLSSRELKGSTIITTNLDFDEWVKPLGCTKLTGSLVSRLCRRADVVELEREIDGRMQDTLDWLASRKNK